MPNSTTNVTGASASAAYSFDQLPLLASVRGFTSGMAAAERRAAAHQLQVLLRDYYVHLPLKRSSLGIDPVQELTLVVDEADYFTSDADYFARLLDIINRLRDRHTAISLPSPWRDMVAFLPFAVESSFDATNRRLLVSKTMSDLGDPRFTPGVEITHWNGVPIRQHIESLSARSPGANPFARIAVTLRSLTARPLGYMLPPDEDWVVLNYLTPDGVAGTVLSPWYVYTPQPAAGVGLSSGEGLATALGLDRNTLQVNSAWYDLYARKGGITGSVTDKSDPLGHVAQWRAIRTARGEWGYIRLFSFDAPDPAAFVQRFAEVLAQLPPDGVVIDLRGNPGGTIPAGEALMGLFTNDVVKKQPVSFRNTPSIRRLGILPLFARWKRSLDMQLETGEIFTQGYSLDNEQALPRPLTYRGRVVLIIDALCYSTTDFFCAGMQDNGLATVIGVDPVTGAGGANVWSHDLLCSFVGETGGGELEPLPTNLNFDVAIRRSIRVGRNEGLPVEGSGVFAEIPYFPTRADVLGNNNDLISFACDVLANLRDAQR